jgi:uncharacterized protein (TIGR00369 family)
VPESKLGVAIPFIDHLGITLQHMAQGQSELHWSPQPEHLNSFGVAHGGASMTLLDATMAAAARSFDPSFGVVTIEMKTTFMQAGEGQLVARGQLLHRTATMAFTQATITDAQGRICTQATGTFKYVRRLPIAGRQIQRLRKTQPEPVGPADAASASTSD